MSTVDRQQLPDDAEPGLQVRPQDPQSRRCREAHHQSGRRYPSDRRKRRGLDPGRATAGQRALRADLKFEKP